MEKIPHPEPIELRPYQLELTDAACKGINTIICAPTGSGKTIVTAYIISQHFRNIKAENKTARVGFIFLF